jgi:hypothetical protein
LIQSVGSANWKRADRISFEAVRLHFDSDSTLAVTRSEQGLQIQLNGDQWSWDRDPRLTWAQAATAQAAKGVVTSYTHTIDPPWSVEVGDDVVWSNAIRSGTAFFETSGANVPEWVRTLPLHFPLLYISDQRLLIESTQAQGQGTRVLQDAIARQAAVAAYASELASRMSEALTQYAARSQSLDRFFPHRVVAAMAEGTTVEEDDLRGELKWIARERAALQEVGLLELDQTPGLDEASELALVEISPVLQVYARDTLEKFKVLDDLRVRLELFLNFLNQHYESKRLVVDRERGYFVLLDNGSELPASELSSGEQHMLVLAYQVLFGTNAGTLILIDEPELSLHVLWQATLVDDLKRMGEARGLNFVLASHSPTLIGARDDLVRSLD